MLNGCYKSLHETCCNCLDYHENFCDLQHNNKISEDSGQVNGLNARAKVLVDWAKIFYLI